MQAAKTNVMRVFDAHKFGYECFTYTADPSMSGVDVACEIGLDADSVFKTLVARCRSGKICVFMVPVAKELDLKKAALVSGEKSVSMLKSKELLGVTGYVHGGCSPVGMKKIFDTYKNIVQTCKQSPILLLNEADQFLSTRVDGSSGSDKMHNQMQNIFFSLTLTPN